MFDAIAARYDQMNRILSLGLDQGWRRRTAAALNLPPQARVLDVATGTADLALVILQTYADAHVVGVDPSANMLNVASVKRDAKQWEQRLSLVQGDAQMLDFPRQHFDAITIAFGIRNVPDRPQALRAMHRVLKPGGTLAVLELNEPAHSGFMASLTRFYMRQFVPRVGAWLSSSREYRYLQTSIAAFPSPESFCTMLSDAGFAVQRSEALGFGACTLFVASAQPSPAS